MSAQPDLFANSVGERMAEVRRHGSGERPRFFPEPANDEEEPYFSPVQFAEELRRHERR